MSAGKRVGVIILVLLYVQRPLFAGLVAAGILHQKQTWIWRANSALY